MDVDDGCMHMQVFSDSGENVDDPASGLMMMMMMMAMSFGVNCQVPYPD